MIALLGMLALTVLAFAQHKHINPNGLNPTEKKIHERITTIGGVFAIFSLGISYLVYSDPSGNGLRFHELGIVIRIIIGSVGIGYGLTMAQRGTHRSLVLNTLLWAAGILVPPLVEILS